MRIDIYLFEHGFAESRTRAQFLIGEGAVFADGIKVGKPSLQIDENIPHKIEVKEVCPYVSVGGMKLEAALDTFGFSPNGMICADIGSSTGGFTDCLLKHGATHVFSIDSGTMQLHPKLYIDKRVTPMEGCNARYITKDDLGTLCSLSVCDVSFISQCLIIPSASRILDYNGTFITLIKPQFELDKRRVGKGVVTDRRDRADAILSVFRCALEYGLNMHGLMVSPVSGGAIGDEKAAKRGNREYLAIFDRSPENTFSESEIYGFVRSEDTVAAAVRNK